MSSEVGKEIHARLADHQPTDYIAMKVRRKVRVVRWHRAGHCQCSERAIPSPESEASDALQPAPGPRRMTVVDVIRDAYIAGMSVEEMASDISIPEAPIWAVINADTLAEADRIKASTVARVAEQAPGKWLAWEKQEVATAKRLGTITAVDPEVLIRFFVDLVRRQRGLLIDREFPDWIGWLRDLASYRYPELAAIIDSAIEVEERALVALIDGPESA